MDKLSYRYSIITRECLLVIFYGNEVIIAEVFLFSHASGETLSRMY